MWLDDFYDRVAEAPDDIAVQDGPLQLTYRALADRASALATVLAGRGAAPDTVVAVYADRSAELVIAELAALMTGAAYLPLDPAHPAARTSELLTLSGAVAVVTTSRLAADRPRFGMDILVADVAGQPGGEVARSWPRPDDNSLAYVIYTSGSTGRPKGVAVTHASLANLMRWRRKAYQLRRQDRTTVLCSPGFDVSVWDIWPTLAAGGTLVVPPAHVRTSPADLVTWLADERITATFLPTPLAEAVLDQAWPDRSVLRLLVTGGSALQRGVPPGLPFTFVNLYGPAECTVGVTTTPVLPGGPVPPPIGVPVDGVRCYVLDGLEPVPDGEPGEMCLAGACVARGYLGDPAATARSFVPDIGIPGQRMYRTGDQVRRRPDGSFEFLGRLDDQVKIRGFRIEPGEVAAVLRQHPAVRESFVAAERPGRADPRLVGYVAAEAAPDELLKFAESRLPGYMVPSAIVVLPALPLTPNGKVDRAALPAPGREAAGLAGRAAPLRTATERRLAEIVARLLGDTEVGADDDFFALGGTSLMVGKLSAQIAAELHVTVSLPELYSSRTISEISAILDRRAVGDKPRTAGSRPDTWPVPPTRPPVRRAHGDGVVPLSLPQERVWFFEQFSPGNLAYNFQATVSLRGPVDPVVLRRALDEIVRRHEILRTAFVGVDGVAQQRRVAGVQAPLRVLDLPADRAEEVIASELRTPFDLTRPPLARWLLLRHGDRESTFVHVEHHFVHDGWSLAVLLTELSALYQAFAAGQPSPLPELAVQYADYALWQREWMRGDVLRAHVAHWTDRLAGAPAILELPADRPRPPAMTFRGAAPRVRIPAELSRALRSFSQQHRVSLFSTMYAGFAALLYRYTSQQDLLVGTGVANRTSPELEPLLGMLVNTLVLRTKVDDEMPFTDLLGQVQQTVVDALAWSDTPVDAVIEAIGPSRDPSRTPLFQVMFSFHDSAVPDLDFGEITGTVTERANGSAKCDLNVIVIPRAAQRLGRTPRPEDDDLYLIWEHSTDLFDESTMTRMIGHYLNLLADAVARPATQVRELSLLTDHESQMLGSWSRGPVVTDDRPVTELVAEHVRRTPDAVAVSDPVVTLTYRELDQRARTVAASLAGRGVGPGSVVAVYADRSAHLVAGELAVLMAGAAFLPLDPDYPPRRVAELLAASRAAAVLTTRQLLGELRTFDGPTVLLDQAPAASHLEADERPAVPVHPQSLAYVIYTSGSTGRPKGVQATHGGLASVLAWVRQAYRLGPADRSTMVASPAFDASVWEVWAALTSGGTLLVPPQDVRADYRVLTSWIVAQKITWAFAPTPLAEAMLDEAWPVHAALRFLLTGGDVLRRTVSAGLPFTFVNHYGPTETTVLATEAVVPPGGSARPPIGRPLGGVRTYVLAGLERAPVGVPGELYIGGAGVTRGYLGDPAATAAAFIPDPWEPGQRMYRSGDRVRWLPDGQLEFLGRMDDQVKIRGFRIEPGEIASTLREHPGVADAAVLARPDASGRLRLAAYVAGDAGPADLRSFLASRLPSYMVPDYLVPMTALPRNQNGKVDKAELPPPEAGVSDPSAPARTEAERRIASLWKDLLGVDAVGADDDFFGLGGYSLLIAKMLAQVGDVFGHTVPLSVFLAAPTVAGLAAAIEAGEPAVPAEPGGGIDVDALSDDEAAALLAILTSDGEGG